MRRFRYRLETVLRHRATLERLRLQAFAEVQQQLAEADRRLAALADERSRLQATWPRRIDLADIERREFYLGVLAQREAREQRVREGIAARLEEERAALLEARRARQAMESLRAKAYEDYLLDVQRSEQNLLDEIATTRHGLRAA
jgi:flagellar export protein FliJ